MNFERGAASDGFLVGIAFLTIVSGALMVLSGLPLLDLLSVSPCLPPCLPSVQGQTVALGFAILGMFITDAGAVFLTFPRGRTMLGGVVLVLSTIGLLGSGSGLLNIITITTLVIASVMGVLGELLGVLSRRLEISETPSPREGWLKAFPFVLAGVGLWEYGSIFVGCGPPEGIGTRACELLGPSFYTVSMLVTAAVLSVMAIPIWEAINRRYHGS